MEKPAMLELLLISRNFVALGWRLANRSPVGSWTAAELSLLPIDARFVDPGHDSGRSGRYWAGREVRANMSG